MNPEIFRRYDIRGVAADDLTDEVVTDIGRAFGSEVRAAGGTLVVVGRDARVSSPRVRDALSQGLIEGGCSVMNIGIVTTPLLYFAANYYGSVDGLAMITGSHNPPQYNGLKLGVGKVTMGGAWLQRLRERIDDGDYHPAAHAGEIRSRNVLPVYLAYLQENLRFGPNLPKIVIDAGNGTGGLTAMPFLERAGFDVTGLYLEPDGTFPNHEADPTVEANLEDLRRAVKDSGADLGIGYDGDADRLGVIDAQGEIIWGDRLMILFSRAVLAMHPGATIVAEVKCSKTLFEDIERRGGRPIMWAAGHTLIKEKMRAEKALLGGEMSGHIFFNDRYYGFDDACYATGRLLEILSHSGQSIRELLDDVPVTFSTPELRVPCSDESKFDLVDAVRERLAQMTEVIHVDGVRAVWPDGWGLVRASNTQPLLVLRFEADSPERRDEIRALVEGVVEELRELLGIG